MTDSTQPPSSAPSSSSSDNPLPSSDHPTSSSGHASSSSASSSSSSFRSLPLSFRSSSSSVRSSSTDVVFCEDCMVLVTVAFLTAGNHRNHRFSDVQKAAVNQKEILEKNWTELQKMVKKVGNIKERNSTARKHCDDVYKSVTESLNIYYSELWELLEQNREQALLLLESEKESLQKQLDQDENGHQDILRDIQEKIQQLEGSEDSSAETQLGEIKQQLESLESMIAVSVDNEEKFDGMRLRALEDSVKNIVQKNKKLLPRPWEFSEVVTLQRNETCEGTAPWSSVVAVESFREGQHYWEVEVGGSGSWAVGVVEQDWKKDGLERPLGRERKSWVLESDEGDLMALHGDDLCTVKGCGVQRLGVFVDCDKGRVKFYDVNTGNVVHMFFTKFQSAVHPAVSFRNNSLRNTSNLTVCKLFPSTEDLHH